MLLTNEELENLRLMIETQTDLDEELLRRCGHLVHLGAFDEAVRSAFVLLEERLRLAIGEEGMTGTALANKAFNATDGPLSKHLGKNQSEREGMRELYSGAFKLFRNPAAHGAVGYSAADGKEILGLVNLMLRMLKRVEELPPPDLFPANVDGVLDRIEQAIGPAAVSRLRVFLGKCVKAGMDPDKSAKQWVPFKKRALVQFEYWDKPKRHLMGVFYVIASDKIPAISFPTNYYYINVIGFDVESLTEALLDLGFVLRGKDQEPTADLRLHNSQEFFEGLEEIVMDTAVELEMTLKRE